MNKSDLQNRLEEFLTELKYAEKSANTIKKYRCNIMGFINHLDPDTEITKDTTLDYKKLIMEKGYKTSTVNSYIISINKYLKWLDHKDLIVKQLKQQRKSSLEEVINTSEYKRMLRFAKSLNRMDIYFNIKILAIT